LTDLPRRLTVDDFRAWQSSFPDEMKNDDGGQTIGIANSVIAHFLGRDWFAAHIRHDVPKPGFLNLDFSTDRRREATVFRVVELAENLFNLQHIAGFDGCIAQMRAGGEKIESTVAELDFGRFLYIHEVDFRFVEPQLRRGDDYDFELVYPDGLLVPADAKCKFESTQINLDSVRNSLNKARKQLPADRAGIIFMKVPQSWLTDIHTAISMVNLGQDFLRNTDRVVSIKFYVSFLDTVNGMVRHRHAFREITNEASRFHGGRNWGIFADYEVPASWNGMPPKWQRIFFFPKSEGMIGVRSSHAPAGPSGITRRATGRDSI
jgi:hypothetical protein